MRRVINAAVLVALLGIVNTAQGHIEAHYTLGQVATESTNILVIEVVRVNREKNLVICKKVRDLKGTYAEAEIKQNIGDRGGPGDAKAIMDWAAEGKQALFFFNETGSLTCTGQAWHQAFREGQWWAMSHAEPFMGRTYYGNIADFIPAVEKLLDGKEVVIPCLADGPRATLEKRTGKVHTMRASLKRMDYNPKRDVVAVLGNANSLTPDGKPKRVTALLEQGSAGWKMTVARPVITDNERWRSADFDDKAWKPVKAPVGYGEAEISNRKGTVISEVGQTMLFRRVVDVSGDVLKRKDLTLELRIASDDSAIVYVNGKVVSDDSTTDHEFEYWNQTVQLAANVLRPGNNVIAVVVLNKQGSSDLYLDMELTAESAADEK